MIEVSVLLGDGLVGVEDGERSNVFSRCNAGT
jgi:hypothetical protein